MKFVAPMPEQIAVFKVYIAEVGRNFFPINCTGDPEKHHFRVAFSPLG